MAGSRVRKVIDLGEGWKQVVYMSEVEFLILNLFVIFPLQLLIWSCFKLPFMLLKFIYELIKSLIIKGYNFYKNKR
jgi:hypothetical protein